MSKGVNTGANVGIDTVRGKAILHRALESRHAIRRRHRGAIIEDHKNIGVTG
jgi:hypothetical protein